MAWTMFSSLAEALFLRTMFPNSKRWESQRSFCQAHRPRTLSSTSVSMFLHRRHLSSRRLCLLTPETHCMQSCVSYLRDAALALLYPTLCRVCGKPVERWADGIACAACWESAEEFSARACFCPKCGIVLQVPLPGGACGRCEALSLKGARSCGPYDGALCESVRWLKSHPQIANRLGGWLAEEGEALAAAHNCELIIPVPLHPARLKER